MDLCFYPCQNRARTEWVSSWPSGLSCWGLWFGGFKPQRPSHSFHFIFELFYSEMRHWINYVDYEGPSCSLRIIKKGYPSGELFSNFACECVCLDWMRLRQEKRESRGEPVSFPLWWMSLLAPVLAQVQPLTTRPHGHTPQLIVATAGRRNEELLRMQWLDQIWNMFKSKQVRKKILHIF